MDVVNLILVFLTVVLTAIILYLTYKAQRDSEESVRLQRRQAALLPDLRFAVIAFGRDPHNPALGFVLFEIANVGRTMVTQAHARVLFDGKQLEPVSAAPPTVREDTVEYEQFYNDLKKLGVLSVEMGGDLIEVNMIAAEIPPAQQRSSKATVAVQGSGKTELPYRLVCAEGYRGEGRTRITFPEAPQGENANGAGE
jgi:hypothetical protein